MTITTFSYQRANGGVLSEHYDGDLWWLTYTEGEHQRVLPMYRRPAEHGPTAPVYLGHTLEEVCASGTDLLGQALLSRGEVRYDDVVGVLPRVCEGAYCFLGGTASHANLTVDTRGVVYPQPSGRDSSPTPVYDPWDHLRELKDIMPRQIMLAEEYPILINVFETNEETVELIYFVEPGDSDRDPVLWIREKRYTVPELAGPVYAYRVAAFSRETPYASVAGGCVKEDVDRSLVVEAFADTVAYWVKFSEQGAKLSLPEERLARAARGNVAAAAVTCTADRPHYGHRFYGKELHDNFPPNYIWLIETGCVMGRERWAKRVFEQMINYALTDEGRFAYRQGEALGMGASATEYGCLLFLANRYFDKLCVRDYEADQIDKLIGMGNVILSHCVSCPEFNGRVLVKMCAEADTNSRVHVYLNNNLWSVRGLRALDGILHRLGRKNNGSYKAMADTLWGNVLYLLKERSVQDSRFGLLPPFRFDYTPMPHTLSYCRETFAPMSNRDYGEYVDASKSRGAEKQCGQDVTENCYANYRYYPEALSAMLLPEAFADGAAALREKLGGELMGMTRFRSWVDNWPVLHYARFLIETGRTDKYLLLLYAHTELHGNRERLCYYEQIKLNGAVSAHDCLPSLLTTPCMVGWMFAYEPVDGGLRLLSALPKSWYTQAFSVRGIGYSGGKVDIMSTGEVLTVRFSEPAPRDCVLVWRACGQLLPEHILSGSEYIEGIEGNRILLKSGITVMEISVKQHIP